MKNGYLTIFGLVFVVALVGFYMQPGGFNAPTLEPEAAPRSGLELPDGQPAPYKVVEPLESFGSKQKQFYGPYRLTVQNGMTYAEVSKHVGLVNVARSMGNVYLPAAELAEWGMEVRGSLVYTPDGRRVLMHYQIPATGGAAQIVRADLI